jgi:hypothetical protein
VEVVAARRQRGGGWRDRLGQWRMRRGGGTRDGVRHGAMGDQRRQDGVGWADGHGDAGGNSVASIGARGRDERIGLLGERRVRK